MFIQSLLALLVNTAFGNSVIKINSVNEFIDFSNNVNSGTGYSGTTVLLDSDLTLSGKTLEPIGKDDSNYFLGVFDGQGHIISNLEMNSSSQYTGLFGYSEGLTIKNVMLDSSCSITSSYGGSNDVYVGGIIGDCYASSGECNIENSVNMADVTISGNSNKYSYSRLYLGGIAGKLYSSYDTYVKNCANYGSVTRSGTSESLYIGGIVGDFSGSSSYYAFLYNCINYGTVTYNGTTTDYLVLGGITGWSYYAYIENCVGAGKISTQNTLSGDNYIGSIAGSVGSYTYINYCYYTSELSEIDICGSAYPIPIVTYALSYDSAMFLLSETISIGGNIVSSLVDALNAVADYYFLRDYSKWLFNREEKSVTFTINSRTSPITIDYQIILLPNLASEGSFVFDGWYTDNGYAYPLESFEIDEDKTLYGRFEENIKKYTITFDARKEGVSVPPITAQFGAVVALPSESIREHCSVAWWENEYGDNVGLGLTTHAHNFTLYAVWKCTHITTPEDFVGFSKIVNSGTDDFSETTIYLDSDLSLSGKTLDPIGKDESNYFRGVFDGQGHIISDLKMNSSSQYTGLFGYSKGLTIRNVVLDSSCFITSSFSGPNSVYIGAIIGYCDADDGECNIENSVNMADVAFNGDPSEYTYLSLGGIAGELCSPDHGYDIHVKNCANYGSTTHTGTSGDSYIGGIVGYLWGSSYEYVCNCLNYGTITHSGTTSGNLYLGGIAGYSDYMYIENCVSAGKISTQSNPSGSYVGSIVGYAESDTDIIHCYYTCELSGFKIYGTGTPESISYAFSYDNITFELNETVSVGKYAGTSLINALNAASDYYLLYDYSKWLLNKEKKAVKFIINNRTNPITMDYQIIHLPSLASEENITFDGWYTDAGYKTPLKSFEATEDKELYGRFEENTNNYTISFNTRREGVSVPPITAQYLSDVTLPSDVTRGHCAVAWWETEYGENVELNFTMPAHNFTLYAVWKCTRITTPDEFIDFSKIVNSGTDEYSETTIYLDSDLSLSGKVFEPIGEGDNNYFGGVFDGQGHVISDLKMNSYSYYIGLFGYSEGLTIRNVVLDSSCAITISYSSSGWLTVGGIVGDCSGWCNIENNVNMADIAFNGNISDGHLNLGGIAGELYSSGYVKNCANYGSITHSGTSGNSYIGGIVSDNEYYGLSSYSVYLYNCINYGTITYSGTSESLSLGSITGRSYSTYIENCVSAGKIFMKSIPSPSFIGSIVGVVGSDVHVKYCYYTSSVGISKVYGYAMSTPVITGTPTSPSIVDSALIAKLNNYTKENDAWNKWLLNEKNASVSFIINYGKGFVVNSQIVLLPDLSNNSERNFGGWYTDANLNTLFTSNKVDSNTTLYGVFCGSSNYIVTFDANGGNEFGENEMSVGCMGYYGTLPENMTRTEHVFAGWFTGREGGYKVESGDKVKILNNHTLYARWTPNKYTVTLDVNGGNELSETSMIVTFNSPYESLPTPTKEGHVFIGWFTDKSVSIKNETLVSIAGNHTLYAHWEKVTNQVEIEFNTKDLSREDVEEFVKKYTNAKFEITEYDNSDSSDGVRVTIKFINNEAAKDFVEKIRESSEMSIIKKIDFISGDTSFSVMLYPILFFNIISFII